MFPKIFPLRIKTATDCIQLGLSDGKIINMIGLNETI